MTYIRPLPRSFTAILGPLIAAATIIVSGCTPRIELAPSKEPVTINLNVKIDHEVRVKVERDLEDLMEENKELF